MLSMATAKATEPTVFCWGETIQLILYHKDWWNLVDNKIIKIFELRRKKHRIVVSARGKKELNVGMRDTEKFIVSKK